MGGPDSGLWTLDSGEMLAVDGLCLTSTRPRDQMYMGMYTVGLRVCTCDKIDFKLAHDSSSGQQAGAPSRITAEIIR